MTEGLESQAVGEQGEETLSLQQNKDVDMVVNVEERVEGEESKEMTSSSLETVSELEMEVSKSESIESIFIDLLPNAQLQKRPAGSPLDDAEGKKLRANYRSVSSSLEEQERIWPSASPNEVSFLQVQLRSSSPKERQEIVSAAPAVVNTRSPDLKNIEIKEEQVSQEIL